MADLTAVDQLTRRWLVQQINVEAAGINALVRRGIHLSDRFLDTDSQNYIWFGPQAVANVYAKPLAQVLAAFSLDPAAATLNDLMYALVGAAMAEAGQG